MLQSEIYQGQFGEFIIERRDRLEVIIYRLGLTLAASCFVLGTISVLLFGSHIVVLNLLTVLFFLFCGGLGISLVTIHIYLAPLKRLLQIFCLVGTLSGLVLLSVISEPLALYVYNHPMTLWGIGFSFAALTGIYFKEGFCFQRLETKLLTPLVPIFLLGHMFGIWSVTLEKALLLTWAILFLIFAIRKLVQPIPPDIGDKSVFTYLKTQSIK
ncbi:DUF2301 domain-containing membrane protein [Gloeocapsa sp. PCC 73106]|uniref:DUF2301 domain-containing membrane protein n=1 Tax=Gloeocapsa sp. PCC 73106 TaxID=102232 RepID=UPI0002ABBA26|nr:DUF2301 domain-containing membrane protein [Gloeocapsa sp. PCC 73106]ELR99961.1 uncharacterized integral membrane protein [Gloeocapsa sp. PCC 73106]